MVKSPLPENSIQMSVLAAGTKPNYDNTSTSAGGRVMQSQHRRHESRLTLIYVAVIALVAVGNRLFGPYVLGPHASFTWNLMPVGALGLFAGSRLSPRWSWAVPLAVMLISDLLLIPAYQAVGFSAFSLTSTPIIYLSFLLYALLGRSLPRKSCSPLAIGSLALAGSGQFFLITNLACWAFGTDISGHPYEKDWTGVLHALVAGLPFAWNSLVSDLVFSGVLFAGHAAIIHSSETSPIQETAQ